MTDDLHTPVVVPVGTPLHDDLIAQATVSMDLMDMAGPEALCRHRLATIIELMTAEAPPEAVTNDSGRSVAVVFGMDLIGHIVWLTDDPEPVFQAALKINDPVLKSLMRVLRQLPE